MQKDLISIVIPVYNVENYLNRCIESIISQTYENIEIILINDGSKDNSLLICKEYKNKDKRIKVIDKKNEGVSIARNIGVEKSSGKYVIFVDSDDWIEKTFVENLHKKISEYNVDICIGGCINYSDKNQKPF